MSKPKSTDSRKDYFMDIDRMVNEGLAGGDVGPDNGFIEETTTDTMGLPDSALQNQNESVKKKRRQN
ncbi:MAG: hypothetical protein LOD92_00380 [Bacillales bacterium]